MYSIREAILSDFSGINRISRYLGYSELPDEKSKTKLEKLISLETDFVYVAESNHVIVGWIHVFAACRLASPNFYEIGGLAVNPDYRGQGVGKELVNHALYKHRGKWRARCNEKRLESHKFYEAIGFKGNKIQRIFEKRS